MPKKAQPRMTPGRVIWHIIESEMRAQKVTQGDLAKRSGFNKCTVSADSNDPERMPLQRVWIYFAALGISPAEILRPIADAHVSRLLAEQEAHG